MQKNKRKTIFLSLIVLFIGAVGYFYWQNIGFFGINTSDCLQYKYFYVNRLYKKLKDGDFVVFRYPGKKIYPHGTLFVKSVGCVSGEKMITKLIDGKEAFFCQKRFLGYACDRKKYKQCPEAHPLNEIIPKGYFYAYAPQWDAYDSRYYGLVSIKNVVGTAHKIF